MSISPTQVTPTPQNTASTPAIGRQIGQRNLQVLQAAIPELLRFKGLTNQMDIAQLNTTTMASQADALEKTYAAAAKPSGGQGGG